METKQKEFLIGRALEAREQAYAPYSGFAVGAALLCADGEVFLGVNVENGSYGGTICAERSALVSAVSAGKRDFTAIAVVGGEMGKPVSALCPPCGICRQFMAELCTSDFTVLLFDGQNAEERTLAALLPDAFKL